MPHCRSVDGVARLGQHARPRRRRGAARRNGSRRAARSAAGEKSKRRMPSAATNGIAWNGFSALLVIVGKPGSPVANSSCPWRSTTAIDPMCTLSTASPRMTATSGAWPRRAWRSARGPRRTMGSMGRTWAGGRPAAYRPLRDRCAKECPTKRARDCANRSAQRRCARAATSTLRQRRPNLLERRRILDRREIAGIAALRPAPGSCAADSLPERVFGNSVTKCTAPGRAIAPSCRSTVAITSLAHLRGAFGSGHLRSILHDGERHRDLALERIGDAHHRHLRDSRHAPARLPRSRACRADGRRR